MPANMRMNVVLPVPFSPNITTISLSVNSPVSICDFRGRMRVYVCVLVCVFACVFHPASQ